MSHGRQKSLQTWQKSGKFLLPRLRAGIFRSKSCSPGSGWPCIRILSHRPKHFLRYSVTGNVCWCCSPTCTTIIRKKSCSSRLPLRSISVKANAAAFSKVIWTNRFLTTCCITAYRKACRFCKTPTKVSLIFHCWQAFPVPAIFLKFSNPKWDAHRGSIAKMHSRLLRRKLSQNDRRKHGNTAKSFPYT